MGQQKDGKSEVYGAAFWRFSLAFYGRAGVTAALIQLQDRAGMDVNLLLFAVWRGAVHGHRLSETELRAAEAAVAPLRREIVKPARGLRRGLKAAADPDIQALRRRVAVFELAAERAAQSRLAGTVAAGGDGADRREAAEANLAFCLGAEASSAEAAVLNDALRDFLARD